MYYAFLIIIISSMFLSIAIFYKKHNFISPLFIHNSIWIAIAFVSLFTSHLFFELSEKIFTLWLIWSLTLNFIFIGLTKQQVTYTPIVYTKLLPNYWVILIPITLYLLYEIIKLGVTGDNTFLLNIRLANINNYNGSKIFSIFSRLYPLIFTLFLFEILLNNNKKNRIATYFYMAVFILQTSGKIAIITPIICYIAVKSVRNEISTKQISLLVAVTALSMLVLHTLRMSSDDMTPLSQIIAVYTYSPIIALGEIEPASALHWGENIFRIGYSILYSSGLSDIQPTPIILDYSYIPIPTNVYTAIYIFYKDFGEMGIISGALIYGVIYSILYNNLCKRKLICSLLYLSILPALIISFFSETLLSLTSMYLQISFFIILIGSFYAKRCD